MTLETLIFQRSLSAVQMTDTELGSRGDIRWITMRTAKHMIRTDGVVSERTRHSVVSDE